jgi:nitrite reductase/ring-hydroxylating ferredoxin subunit
MLDGSALREGEGSSKKNSTSRKIFAKENISCPIPRLAFSIENGVTLRGKAFL